MILLGRLLNKSKPEPVKRNLMSNLKAVLIDLSGTLHIEDESTPEAVKALNRFAHILWIQTVNHCSTCKRYISKYVCFRLRKCDLNIKFLTNTTKESRRNLHERLLKLGFQIKVDEIYTSLWAARELIIKEQLNNPLLLVDDNALEDFIGWITLIFVYLI